MGGGPLDLEILHSGRFPPLHSGLKSRPTRSPDSWRPRPSQGAQEMQKLPGGAGGASRPGGGGAGWSWWGRCWCLLLGICELLGEANSHWSKGICMSLASLDRGISTMQQGHAAACLELAWPMSSDCPCRTSLLDLHDRVVGHGLLRAVWPCGHIL